MSDDHRPLDEKLTALRELQEQMFRLVANQFEEATLALLKRDTERAAAVRERDDEVDALEVQIDSLCERILALHTPVAIDLRRLLTAVKVNTDLERIGDHAKNLAKSTRRLAGWDEFLNQTHVTEMARTVRANLDGVKQAFLEGDAEQARRVIHRDEKANRLYRDTFDTIVELARAHPEGVEALCHLVTTNKALERIGDHAKNIAESIIFLEEGVDIRHGSLNEKLDPTAAERPDDLDGDAISPSQLPGK